VSGTLDVLARSQGLMPPGKVVDSAASAGERGDELVEDRVPALGERLEVERPGSRAGEHVDLLCGGDDLAVPPEHEQPLAVGVAEPQCGPAVKHLAQERLAA
jgi:hypothetical protein